MNEELQSLIDRAMAAGRSPGQIISALKQNGLDDGGIMSADSYIKKKSPSDLKGSSSLSDLRPSVSESLGSERVQIGFDEAAIQQKKKAISDDAAAQVYTAVVKTKGDLNKIEDKQAFANAYTTYRSMSDDPMVSSLPQNPVAQNGQIDFAVVPALKKGATEYINDLIKQEEARKAKLGEKITVPILSEAAAGANALIGGVLKFNEMITGRDSELADFFLNDASTRGRDALIDYGLTEEDISKGLIGNISEGNIGTGLAIFGSTLVQQLPQLAAVALTGGAGLPLLAASAAGSGYASFEDRSDLSEGEKVLYGIGVGAAEYLAERLFLGDINAIRKALGKEGIEGLTKKELGDVMFGALPKGVRGVMEEGTEELLTSVAQQTLGKIIAGEEFNPIEIAESAIYGGTLGGSIYLLSRGSGAIVDPENEAKIQDLKKDLNKTQQAKSRPDIAEEEREILSRKEQETRQAINDFKAKDDDLVARMSEEDRVALKSIQDEISSIRRKNTIVKTEEGKQQLKKESLAAIQKLNNLKTKYDTQEEAGIPSPIVEGEAPIEVQPIEGASQETPQAGGVFQVPVEEGAEATAQTEVIAPIQATVFAAPFYDTKVNNIQEARAIRQSEPYINNLDTVRNASALFNLEIENIDESIGGFVNEAGDKIVEISNIIRVKGTPEDVQNYAAFLATSSPETQEATIAATYVEPDSETHNIDELTISVSDVDGAIEALKENDIYDFTINDSNNTITFLDFSKGADGDFMDNVGKFAKSLERKNISYEKRDIRAIDSKYIGPREREGIFSGIQETLVQQGQTGTELYKQVEQAIARNQEFLAKTSAPISEAIVAEEITEQAVEQEPIKNKKGLSSEQVNEAVSGAERLAKRLGLPTKIIVHNSRKEFNDAMDEVSKSGSVDAGVESGRFIPSANEIHLNLEDMTSEVPFHEVFHAAFVNRFGKRGQKVREKVATDFYNGIVRILRSGSEQDQLLADAVESFTRSGYYTAEEKPEEFLAQTAGFLSTSGDKISKSTMDKLIQWLNNFIAKIAPGVKVNTRGEFIDFMNSFSGALFYSQAEQTNAIDKLGEMEDGTIPLTESPIDVSPEQLKDSSSRKANYINTYISNKYIVDPEKVFEDFRKENGRDPKVWIWMSDQLKRGEYFNPKSGVRMSLEGGIGFAFDAENQKKNIVWASGLSDKTLTERTKDADFIWFMSGSPKSSFNFSKGTTKVFFAEIEAGMQNVKGQTIEGVEIKDGSFDEFIAVVNAIYDANTGKNWVNADKWTNVRKYLNDGKKGLIDKPIRKFVVENMMHEGEGKSMQIPVQKFLHETLGVPQKDVFHSLLRDEALVKNNVRNGDLTLIVKPTGIIRGSNVHDTYPTAITGKIVGVPNKIYSVLDVVPEEAKTVISTQTGLPIPNASPTTQIKTAVGDVGRIYKSIELQTKEANKVYDNILKESSSKSFQELSEASKAGLLIHATKGSFDTFDPQRIYGGARSLYGYGFYFTSRASKALDYGSKFIFTPLNKYNFLDIDAKANNDFANELKSLAEARILKLQGLFKGIELIPKSLKTPLDNALKISSTISGDSKYGKYSIDDLRKFLDNDYILSFTDFSEAMLSVGYDGFQTDDFYEAVIFNFGKLNDNLVKDEADYLKESSSRDVREEILDKEQLSFKQRAVNTAKTFVWSDTQKQIRVFKERMSSQIAEEGIQITKFTKSLNKLLKKADVQTLDLVGDIFDGTLTPENQRILESKPNGSLIFGQANAMRNYIDSFAEEFVNSPEFHAMPEETVNTIVDNFGQYMRGSYRFWKDKNFKPSNAARREAIAYEYEILRAKSIGQLTKLSGLTESEADDFFELLHDETLAQATKVIDDYIADIEKIRNGSDFKKLGIVSPSGIKLPSEQFLRRKELPETIQNLLGKERDPIIRFIDTTIALSNIKYKGHMLYAISESLGGTQFIKNEVTDAEKSTGEYKEVKDKFSPLNGRFVHRDVYEAITNQNIYESDNIWMSGYLTTLQLARKSKVIYNLPSWRKNLTGGWYTMAANGVINPSFVRDIKRRAELFATGETDQETEDLRKIMANNGLLAQDVNANLLGFTNAMYSRTLTGNDKDYNSYVDRARNLIKNFDSVVGQKYAAVDDYTKLVVFRSEIQSFAKKIYGNSYDSLTEAQKNKVHAEAAEFVKQNTPTFSRLPKWYASLAKLPAGDFLSFEFESLRSFGTNILNGQRDLMKGMTDKTLSKEQKAEYIESGSRRLAGSAAILGARLAITSILASLALGDDDELEEDIKNNRPNWMEGHSIIPTKVSKEGIATVYDYSMEDPYGSFFDLATDPLSFPAYVVDLLQPNMGISFLTNLAENKDFYGRDITNSYDSKLTKGYKYGGHTLKSLIIPPFIASSYRDEQKRLEAEADKYSPLDAVGRVASRAVIRDYEYNIPVQFYYFTDQFRTKKEQYSDLTGASRDNRLAELDEIKKMYKSITNIGIKKGNYKMIADANKNVKRALKPAEEAYVLYGYEIPEKK